MEVFSIICVIVLIIRCITEPSRINKQTRKYEEDQKRRLGL